jgi:hypothetical protein
MDSNYLRILQETDYAVRDDYVDPMTALLAIRSAEPIDDDVDKYGNIKTGNPDPRLAFARTRNEEMMPTEAERAAPAEVEADDEAEPDAITSLVQSAPEMIPIKRYVIIDTSVRDWTVQADAYSNIFSFGSATASSASNLTAQVPFYFNNPTIPLAAYETSHSTLLNVRMTGQVTAVPNNRSQIFATGETQPAYFNITAGSTFRPVYGWKYVTSNGTILHTPDTYSPTDPAVKINYFPVFNAQDPAGGQVGIDTYPGQQANMNTFATQLPLSNITEISLVRATLPVRGTQPYGAATFGGHLVYPDSLHGKSYLLMNIQNIQGKYYGGSYTAQQSFSVLTQNTRTLYDGDCNYPAQYSDYYPFSKEQYLFDPPLAQLSNADIQIYDSGGVAFTQTDTMQVVDMVFQGTGKVKFFITQNALVSNAFGDSNVFIKSSVRIGDEIKFYGPTLTRILSDPSATTALRSAFSYLSNDFIVSDICSTDFVPSNILSSCDVGTSFTAVPKLVGGVAGISNAYVAFSNVSSSTPNVCLQQYTLSSAGIPFAARRTLSQDYPLPLMNKNMQATYVMEITTLQPNIKVLKKNGN